MCVCAVYRLNSLKFVYHWASLFSQIKKLNTQVNMHVHVADYHVHVMTDGI